MLESYPLPQLAGQRLPLQSLQQPWYRVFQTEHEPLYFGRAVLHRFDSPDSTYGVLYAGSDLHCAFVETFGHKTGRKRVKRSELQAASMAIIESSRPRSLVDLTGAGLAQLGADNRLCDGDYRNAQRWSEAFYHHTNQPDGVYYRSRCDPSRFCMALFDRAGAVLRVAKRIPLEPSNPPVWLADVLETYEFSFLDD